MARLEDLSSISSMTQADLSARLLGKSCSRYLREMVMVSPTVALPWLVARVDVVAPVSLRASAWPTTLSPDSTMTL